MFGRRKEERRRVNGGRGLSQVSIGSLNPVIFNIRRKYVNLVI